MAASWECPSLPMLSFPLKESSQSTFLGIKLMISAHYEEESDSFQEEIKQLDTLRQNALRPPKDYNGVSVLRRYFAQLHLIRERFPPETIGQLPIDFVWKDAYTDAQYVQEGLQIEQASILYNISALHSILGCRVKRTSEQDMKEAVTHFQCAAGAYTYLDEHFAVNHASRDLSAQFVSLYKNLMLGQAQECLVEKSLKGVGRVKNLTIAKLATRVSEYYLNVSRLLEGDPCNVIVKKHKEWPKLLRMKVFYFQAVSHFYQGCHAEEMGKQGELLAWFQLSLQKLGAIGKIPKSLGDVREAARNFYDHVNDRLQVCKRQNDQVYHDPIPTPDTLEQASGADLVKPVAFHPTDSKNLGKDIFARLVPMRVYEAASVYSEEKAKLLRSVLSSVHEKDEELEQFLLSLNAREIDKLDQGPPSAPDDVLQQHKLLQGKSTVVKKLHSDIQELMKLSGEVTDDLALIAEKKKEDNNDEDTFQDRQGQRSPSQICAGLWKEAENYSKYHTQASNSNSELKSMFNSHYQYLLLLSGPIATLHTAIPKITPMDTPTEDSTDSERWRELMGKVDQMKQQRKALVGQLRDQINKDDITKTLIGHLGSDKETFIDEKMRRHREISDIIRKNLEAQENILLAVTEANAKKAQLRQAAQELNEQQETMFAALVKAGTTFPLLLSKISEGLSFYARLHDNIAKLRKRVLEVVAARNSERESTERRRTPERSVSPAPVQSNAGHHATPPPRPPKKAEFAGNPLAPEHQQLPNGAHHDDVTTLGGQSTHESSTHQPTSIPVDSLEQLQDLQRQQQLQLQTLGLNVSDTLDSQIAQNVVLPVSNQGPPGQFLPPVQQLPYQQNMGVPNIPSQQQGVLNQQIPEQAMGIPPMQQDVPGTQLTRQFSPQPPSEQSDLLSLDIPDQTDTEQVRLEPMSGLDRELHLETSQAIQDLQLLLQPPGGVVSPQTTVVTLSPQSQLEHTSDQPETPSVGVDSLGFQPDQSLPPDRENIPPQSQFSIPTSPPIEPPTTDSTITNVENESQPFTDGGAALPDVLQVSTGAFHTVDHGTPGHELSNSLETHIIASNSLEGPRSLSSAGDNPDMVQTHPVSDGTVTINSISRPIPAPLQSPPAVASPGSEQVSNSWSSQLPSGSVRISTQPTANYSDVHSDFQPHIDENTAQEFIQTEPAASDVRPFPEDIHSNLTEHLPPASNEADTSHLTRPYLASVSHDQTEAIEEKSGDHSAETEDSESLSSEHQGQSSSSISDNLSTFTTDVSSVTTMPVQEFVTTSTQLEQVPSLPQSFDPSSTLTQLPDHNLSMSSFRPISSHPPLNLPTPPSISPLPAELTMPLENFSTFDNTHYDVLLSKQQEKMDEVNKENERQRAQISDQRIQIETYKQQLLLLQQQVTQVAAQQQKQEQDKLATSGQQAALMQLLQQQQGMFSQQQAQLENMTKVTETHRREQQDVESTYKQALAVEREQKSNLQNQLMQQSQEMQRLQQQLQAQAQQYQTLQLQLHQYHTQIQERDKQLVAFRDQHKVILQSLDQKHQQKVSQLIQQVQDYQSEVKKLRAQRQLVLQPTPVQQFISQPRPGSVPGNVPPSQTPPIRQMTPSTPATPSATRQVSQPYGQALPDQQRILQQPMVPTSQPQPVRPSSQPQSFQGGPRLPPPLQPTVPSQGFGQTSQPQFPMQQGQGQAPQGGASRPPMTPGYQQQPPGQNQSTQQVPMTPTSTPQSGGTQMIRQDSRSFRPDQQQLPTQDGVLPPTSSHGFVSSSRPDVSQPPWQQQQPGGSRMPPPSGTPQQQTVAPRPGQAQFGQIPPGIQQPQDFSQPGAHLPPQQFQSPGGQYQVRPSNPGGMGPQFSPAPQQQNMMGPQGFQPPKQ